MARLSKESWGSEMVVAHGDVLFPAELEGFIAFAGEEKDGLVTYQIKGEACEIVTLNSLKPNLDIGSQLVCHLAGFAREKGCNRLWLVTTNDNTNALRFYQKIGFHMRALRPGIIPEYRKIKPEIPLKGADGIPIRDEIELEMGL